jgi:ABC-2 type transport system ATP-binding protein
MSCPIRIDSLSKTYRGKRGAMVNALRDLTLHVDTGEVFGFLGPNGAGKSTTIKLLMGLISATSGTATLFGTDISQAEARRRIGYLPENPALYDFLTGSEYLRFIGSSFAMNPALVEKRSAEVLSLLELRDAANRLIRSYSKGMVQRLGLAQTLLHDPDLYILDEPMSGLDPVGRALVKEIIRNLKSQGKTVFFSTHITADVEAVCDRVGVIVKGRLEALDSVDHILRSGIEGYTVQVRLDGASLAGYPQARVLPGGGTEFLVTIDDLQTFLGAVATVGGRVEQIEPKRKNLEEFFLDIVTGG